MLTIKNGLLPGYPTNSVGNLLFQIFDINFVFCSYIWAASCGRAMKAFDLSTKCCTVKDIATSFNKLRDICMPGTVAVRCNVK